MNPFNVFEAICAGFKDLPDQCKRWLDEKGLGTPHLEEIVKKKGIRRARFIQIICALLCVNGVIVFFYKKRLN